MWDLGAGEDVPMAPYHDVISGLILKVDNAEDLPRTFLVTCHDSLPAFQTQQTPKTTVWKLPLMVGLVVFDVTQDTDIEITNRSRSQQVWQ